MSILLMVAVDGPVELRMSRLGDLGGKCGLGSTFSTAPLQGFCRFKWFSSIYEMWKTKQTY